MSRRPHTPLGSQPQPQPQALRVTRREALAGLSSALVAGPLLSTLGCSADPVSQADTGSSGGLTTGGMPTTTTGVPVDAGTTGATTGTATDSVTSAGTIGGNSGGATTAGGSTAGAGGDAGALADASQADASPSDAGMTGGDGSLTMEDAEMPAPVAGWASGGTAAMSGVADYPDPFEGDSSSACALTGSMTLGPCYDAASPLREDISEGKPGLPMRFGLRVLDADCRPVTDASVDIWQVHALGLYSGNPSPGGAFCTSRDAEAEASLWFRGNQPTDENGVAWFNSCFPGWYSGRALHTHFTVRRPGPDGEEFLTSQVAFPDDLTAEICGSHVDYMANGQPDTSNRSDGVFPSNVDPFIVETQRMSDGALLAWKTLIIRS